MRLGWRAIISGRSTRISIDSQCSKHTTCGVARARKKRPRIVSHCERLTCGVARRLQSILLSERTAMRIRRAAVTRTWPAFELRRRRDTMNADRLIIIRIVFLVLIAFGSLFSPKTNAQSLPAPLACPTSFSYQNGLCMPPAEGRAHGTIFGIMYSTWHCPQAQDNPAGTPIFDIAKILSGQQPYGPYGAWYWKSDPLDGYYCLSRRDDVLRKHAIQLRDAGIRFVYIDASNHPSSATAFADRPAEMIMEPMDAMLRVWSAIPGAPRIVPFVPVMNVAEPMIDWMMARLAQYPQMQLMEEGKPFFLVVANPGLPPDQAKLSALAQNYSYRKMWHHAIPGVTRDSWSFSSFCSNPYFNSHQGTAACDQPITQNNGPEHVSISPAINSFIFSTPSQATPRYSGRTFARQFDTVFKSPTTKFATISDWNSWVAIAFCKKADGGLSTNRAECASSTYEFVDTYTDELSRDMEPTHSQGDYYYRLMKACIAKFARGEACNENSASEVGAMSYGTTLNDSVQRACTYPSSTSIPRLQVGDVYGYADEITVQNNRAILTGWACIVGSNAPTDLHVYLGGPAGTGVFKTALTTALPAEAGVHEACQNGSSVPNRFAIDVTDWMNSNPGQSIYVHAINPRTQANYFLNQSGHCSVPWPETAQAQTGACKITQKFCPNHPSTVGTFQDTWGEQNAGASTNPAACMQRATDYYNWCGGARLMNGQTTTAAFFTGATLKQTVTVGNSCKITQSSCPSYPSFTGTFEDAWGDQNVGASSIPGACMQRATDYYNWCGGARAMNGLTTTATFFTAGAQTQTITVGNSCKITQNSCPSHPSSIGTFEDAWGDQNVGASANPAVCMRRATEYYNWCGGAGAMNGQTTTATFFTAGSATQTITVGASAYYKMSSAASNDVLWPAMLSVDSNPGSVYTSQAFPSAGNNRGTYLAAWLAGGAKTVSKVILTARMQNGAALAFASQYDVYLTAPNNQYWQFIGNFGAKVNAQGVATIQLPSTYSTFGVRIVPKILGRDDHGSYYFQLAEINLAR